MEKIQTDIAIIGGGPGGYGAAFYAAAQGKRVILIEKGSRLGGVCLNCGCIPSKSLLHVAESLRNAKESEAFGITFGEPSFDTVKLRKWKDGILEKLEQGIRNIAARRGVEVIAGEAVFRDAKTIKVADRIVGFEHAIIASGSAPVLPKAFGTESPLIMTSTEALELETVPKRLLVIGAGYIGMELGTVYSALGSKVTVVEALPDMLTGADPDLVRYVQASAEKRFERIQLSASVQSLVAGKDSVKAVIEADGKKTEEVFDRVLVAVGRAPCSAGLGLEMIRVKTDDKGFIRTDAEKRTDEPSVFAVGDVTGGMMLAHKAAGDARKAVDAICKKKTESLESILPAVVFTDPEIAWCGLTEFEARAKNIPVQIVKFPWAASGRAAAIGRTDGATKFLIDPATEKVLGAGICGKGAGELIAEAVLVVEQGIRAGTLGRMVHPHPTLSETLMECAEMYYGTAIYAFSRKRP